MRTRNNLAQNRFERNRRFEPLAPPFRATFETGLERFKRRLLNRLLEESPNPIYNAPLRRAANEAASLAWTTPYPLLVLPGLIEEKALAARRHAFQQERVSARSRLILAQAI